jgi:RimJ/RimL family protein N-acetyltransferase
MLRHAFERWGCIRVELKTSALNLRSRAAIQRIGGREEGVLRHHMINEDGTLRDSVFYSILAEEWPDVRRRLETMLAAPGGAGTVSS